MSQPDALSLDIRAYLDGHFANPVRDPLWGHIYLDDSMLRLLHSAPLQQLNRIKQLGPTFLVYPGATHTRLNHSLGVLQLARRMLRILLAFDSAPQVSLEGVKAFLCAALMHDVGHFPYTHSLKELPLVEHEVLTARIIQQKPVSDILRNSIGVDPAIPAAIVDLSLSDQGSSEIAFFRRLLSSPLDPDKLDYLNRDAYFCGVPYGVQDTDYVLSQIMPHPEYGIGLKESGISALENLLFSKYLMYRAVYWHKTVRIATGMIKKSLYLGLERDSIQPQQLYNLDDEGFFALLNAQSAPEFAAITAVQQRRLYKPICELPLMSAHPPHQRLRGLPFRTAVEARIASLLSRSTGTRIAPLQILIDIPESISFEVDLPVFTGERWIPYAESRSVFTPQVVRDFTGTLQLIRIAIDPALIPLPAHAVSALTEYMQHEMD